MSKPGRTETLPDNLLDHRAVRAWAALKPARVEPDGIEILKLKNKAGWGVPCTDLAQLKDQTVSPDVGTYASALHEFSPGISDVRVRELAECGRFFRLLDEIGWESPPEGAGSRPSSCRRARTRKSWATTSQIFSKATVKLARWRRAAEYDV